MIPGMSKIRFEKTDQLYRITLDDAPLNILDIEMLEELRDTIDKVENDRSCLVIAAEGEKAFSAGASVQDHLDDRVTRMLGAFHDCFRRLHRLDLATIALVRGMALGGGCELAMGCDFVLASDRAKFGQPEIMLGVFPPVAAWQLSRLLPPRRGLELFLVGDSIDSQTAHSLGLVNAVLDSARFDELADEWIGKLLRHSPSSLRISKRAFRIASIDDFEEKLAATEKFYLEHLMTTHDANEGLRAFVEKRKPVWKDSE